MLLELAATLQLPSVSVPKPLWHGGGGSGGSEGGGGDAAIVVKEARKEHHEHSHRFSSFIEPVKTKLGAVWLAGRWPIA